MRRIGQVLHVSPSQKAVIKAEEVPRIGETVLDDRKKPVGAVFDIIGSTASPYVEVELRVKDPTAFVNKELYVAPSKHGPRNRRE